VSNGLQVLRPMFRHRHHLVFCWLLVCQAIYQEKATIKGLARLAPRHIAEWHVRRKDDPKYHAENALVRWRLVRLRRPSWAHMVVVVADAAFASKTNVRLICQRGDFFVIAFARTWRFANGQSLKELVTHRPKKFSRRCWVSREEPGRLRTDWTSTKRAYLRHIREVTIILSKKRRNDGPKQTKILVTHRPDIRARQVVDVSRRRWWVGVSRQGRCGPAGESPTEGTG
jgi:hypothetical protein